MSCERENEHLKTGSNNSFEYIIIIVLYILLAIILAASFRY